MTPTPSDHRSRGEAAVRPRPMKTISPLYQEILHGQGQEVEAEVAHP